MSHINALKCDGCGKQHPFSGHIPPNWHVVDESNHVCSGTCLTLIASRVIAHEQEQDKQLDEAALRRQSIDRHQADINPFAPLTN